MAPSDSTTTPITADIRWSDQDECSVGSFEGVAVEVRPGPCAGEWTARLDGVPVGAAASREEAKALAAERAAADRLQRTLGAQIG
jgi:hypothetical protein